MLSVQYSFPPEHSIDCLEGKKIHSYLSADSSSVVPAGCETSEWTEWTGCSVTCGKGISMRERKYVDPFRADNNGCDLQLIEKEMCASEVGVCEGEIYWTKKINIETACLSYR